MIIAIDVRPEVEAELVRMAALHGKPVEAYAATLLEEATHLPHPSPAPAPAPAPARAPAPVARNMVELFAPLRGLNLDFERDRDPGRDLEL